MFFTHVCNNMDIKLSYIDFSCFAYMEEIHI